jgi:type IV secretory pathway VirB10-like protein
MSLRRFLSMLAVSVVAMTAVFAAIQPSYAEDDENEPNFMSRILGSMGLLQLPGPSIDYSERPPLVVPPVSPYVQPIAPPPSVTTNTNNPWDFNAAAPQPEVQPNLNDQRPPRTALALPQPQEPNSARARNPDFPIDPEVKAAQKRKKNSTRVFSRAEDDPSYSGRRLTPDELRRVKGNSNKSSGTDPTASEAQSTVQQLEVPFLTKMLPMIGREKEKPLAFEGEPERQSLTQPPAGYMTPSKNAPYGIVSKDKQGRDDTRLVHPNMPEYSGPTQTR